jgi:putative tryptophan/tyrosine transport system substrate-binding protein
VSRADENGLRNASLPRCLASLVVVLLFLAAPLATEAQVGRVPRVGVILPGSPEPEYERRLDAFRQALRELGYVDKQNIVLEYRWAHARYDSFPGLIAELLGLKVDVLVVDGHAAAQAAKSATSTTPIVMAIAGDPVGTGLVGSLARPGGNVTGMTLMTPELSAKRLALLKEVVPKAARVAVLRNPDNAVSQFHWRELQATAPKLGLSLQPAEVRRAADIERALATVAAGRVDALFVIEDPVMLPALQANIVEFAARHRLATVTGLRSLVDAGGLMSFGASFPEMFRSAATFVVKILRGARPSDLPVEQPSKFELIISVKTAKALGLMIPPSLLGRADQVIE